MTADTLSAARRIWLGNPDPGDADAVRAYLARRYLVGVPADDGTGACWVLSLDAGTRSRARFRSVKDWLDRKPLW